MRTDNEILQVLLDRLIKKEKVCGLCDLIIVMHMYDQFNGQEYQRLKSIIDSHSYLDKGNFSGYYWEPGLKQPRVEFLQNLINNIE